MKNESFPARLLRLRTKAGLSQRELAAATGITQAAYHALESGKCEPKLSTLRALASALKVKIGPLAG